MTDKEKSSRSSALIAFGLGVLIIAVMNNDHAWMVILAFGSIVAGTTLLLETT